MTKERTQQLQKNFSRMFWIQALLNVKVINVIVTLFYVHRGLSVAEIFYLSIVWALANILFEIPSSYMADKWGRKNTMLFGTACALVGWVFLLFGHSFAMFVMAILFSAMQFSAFSGTDEALVYDTNRELGNHNDSLRQLSRYSSARNMFKMLAPLIAVLIVHDLADWQFGIVIVIDMIAVIFSAIVALTIVEPHHYMDVEESEAGIIADAFQLIRSNPMMMRGMFGKTIGFIAGFLIWRYHQEFLVDHVGLSVIYLGIAWSVYNVCVFFWERYITPIFFSRLTYYINLMNGIFLVVSIISLIVVLYVDAPLGVLCGIMPLFFAERIRWSLYSQFFNGFSKSFNRATTISLANFLKSVLDVPLLFTASLLVAQNMIFPFFFTILLALIVVLFLRVKSINNLDN